MTDPITCPECEGSRGERLGPLFLACRFCAGLGIVGAANEPAERRAKSLLRRLPVALHWVWFDPYVASVLRCRMCMGARTVVHLGEEAGTLITVPCLCTGTPRCGPGCM